MLISFSVYNANFNLYGACNFVFLFSPGGTVMPRYRFKVMKLDLYENVKDFDTALQSPEVQWDIMVFVLLLRLILKEASSYIYIRWKYGTSMPYITNIWNLLELSLIHI